MRWSPCCNWGFRCIYISDCKNRKCFFQIWQPVRANLSGRHNNKKVRKKTKLHIAARGNMSNSCGSESPWPLSKKTDVLVTKRARIKATRDLLWIHEHYVTLLFELMWSTTPFTCKERVHLEAEMTLEVWRFTSSAHLVYNASIVFWLRAACVISEEICI